ncbi:2-C-methyl-D-erythritol 4-phosphate cytidylyltransferase [Gemmatirosa kalamazoonensis]|uniref:2-C-methyl-D-erythritol 4-phosphate cytidylyltransferase n=1 Tax=Gemmatirosa kalamazoonensis TaxID=861299 RepID=W0RK89_9BACT|nr:2-C-methyl-D-erythritol 4-phosphate cytidylyltransferase [Gemmatirosa kalamazoonensis]AHG90852.1 2-C-methyl-D-erythritol 4-phosphate cytidylyltransferase [Gemmatirosa kalamazoonensis]
MTDPLGGTIPPRRVVPPPAITSRPGAEPRTHDGAPRDVGVVIVAAGRGTRVGGEELKQFRWVAGRPMLLHSVQTFMARPDVALVVVVLPKSHAADPPPWLFQCDIDRLLVSVGGRERSESVANGLEDMPDEVRTVLIHDAARPLVPDDMIERVVASARDGHAVVPALPVVDTLKEVADDGTVARTVDRARLWRIQTPQGFPRDLIMRAHGEARRAQRTFTDDAGLCEWLGIPVRVVRGSERALKITDESDFARAEALSILQE